MTPILVFDIETIPDVAGIRRLENLPDTLSDAEVAEHAFAVRREKTGGDFLPHHLQRIAAISCVFRDNNGFRVRSLGTLEDGEAALVQSFYRVIEKYTPQLVSWNGGGFDLPVLNYRALINGIPASRFWDLGEDDREFKWNNYISRYHARHTDLMDVLAMYQARANAPLDALAKMCGFPGKMGMDGSQVWQAYQEGRIEEIRNYCETDVVNTYLLYCRFQLIRGAFSAEEYADEINLVKNALALEAAPQWAEYLAAFDQ
ncbi:3'-5' exonuclease [Paraburkholderia sp.]|uniref:3'-5' exonuclease n=1 Tax=Paraburkholderia sp. TaxID=1926495 RepID=UPI002D5F5E01|nr:3'-5' exonuclease [Paraburkholderia sp.]HZZ06377.1 3'-5' exonuclease [Paraburkholderia sp.]